MRVLSWVPALLLCPVGVLVLEANGLTATTLAANSLWLGCGLWALGQRRAVALLVLLDVGFVGARLARPPATSVLFCADERCSTGGTAWQRIIDEREATRAGLFLSRHLGAIHGQEFAALDALLEAQWATAPDEWKRLPNPLLMQSSADRVESLRVRAGVAGKRPCIVFLHGFGGLLSLYVRAIAEGTGGAYDVVAPALGPRGAWWSLEGQAVLARTLDTLGPDVDRDRVYLVGLSNGGVGASTALRNPSLSRRFAGVVLLSGIGDAGPRGEPTPKVLVISGTNDPRFTGSWVGQQVTRLRQRGTQVTWRQWPADHFLILTHAREWTRAFVEWR